MAAPAILAEQLQQLDDARKLVLGDVNFYPAILGGILPIINRDAKLEIRRWGADFLAETFSNPLLPPAQKETMCLTIMELLRGLIENPNEDPAVVKSCVQAAASVYPLVVRWMYVYTLPTCPVAPALPELHVLRHRYSLCSDEALEELQIRAWQIGKQGLRLTCMVEQNQQPI